ncbi:MAG: metallophosphoesterase [Rhodomicrobium sp.]
MAAAAVIGKTAATNGMRVFDPRNGRANVQMNIPEFCLAVLFGGHDETASFIERNFEPAERILFPRTAGAAASESFADATLTLARRLSNRELAVTDATDITSRDRAKLVSIAKQYYALPVAIILDPRDTQTSEGGRTRPANPAPSHAKLAAEGFRSVHYISSREQMEAARVLREPLPVDKRNEKGPFDIIGDIHGCATELEALLAKLGYQIGGTGREGERNYRVLKNSGRRAIFVGDLVDRGPRILDVLSLVMAMTQAGEALCVIGNHDDKLLRWLKGRDVKVTHGLEKSTEQMAPASNDFKDRVKAFLEGLPSHLWLDGGKLVVAHAGIADRMIGRSSPAVREFCLYGEATGKKDEHGLPVRGNWAARCVGSAKIVYGHTPTVEPVWLNNTICIDTGCVFGGALTALRWPEKDLVSVPANSVYSP